MLVLKEISRGSSSLNYSSSPWNQRLNESQIGILAKESTVYVCFTEKFEYECILAELDEVSTSYQNTPELGITPGPAGLKYLLVFGNEYGTKRIFSHVLRPMEVEHLELPRVLEKRCTKEALQRFRRTNQRFQKTVFTLLSLLRPYSLC